CPKGNNVGGGMIKKRILFIDDEEDFTKFIKLNLEETGKYEESALQKGEKSDIKTTSLDSAH
ncbi:MAG: hypothetical protein ABSE81_06930, partial [Candidatus Omnitrophota bacterium]